MTEQAIPQSEILAVLIGIASYRLSVRRIPQPGDHLITHWGNESYQVSNGWQLTVFFDCGEWDHIDNIVASDGRRSAFPEYDEWAQYPLFMTYTPPPSIRRQVYGEAV